MELDHEVVVLYELRYPVPYAADAAGFVGWSEENGFPFGMKTQPLLQSPAVKTAPAKEWIQLRQTGYVEIGPVPVSEAFM